MAATEPPEVARDGRGRWCLAVTVEGFGYGTTGRVRALRPIPGVPPTARADEARIAAAGWLARRGREDSGDARR